MRRHEEVERVGDKRQMGTKSSGEQILIVCVHFTRSIECRVMAKSWVTLPDLR